MSNKKVIETYVDGFRASDHAKILSCLTDSVVWEMPGLFHLVGKEQFDNNKISRLTGYLMQNKQP